MLPQSPMPTYGLLHEMQLSIASLYMSLDNEISVYVIVDDKNVTPLIGM